ncbi:asialoglycoprotein receptor-like 1 isoform X2 [Pseudoliparis swirei]|uniref:asialoglycoprotein receptor-like 1 isoform X2 n=1 Tax=Pseudoliparis swirei TaxID=2059687 RepID=UPI0024BDDA76|nr:asialoglycoprotein receptor-like 1 isoform X2 [Pseudoliparis swirei]
MESRYHRFGSTDNSSVGGEHKTTVHTNMKKIVGCVLYGVLVLLLLILLMVTGIKFSQLNKEITDVKLNLEEISNGRTSFTSSGQEIISFVDLMTFNRCPCSSLLLLLLLYYFQTQGVTTVQEVFLPRLVPVRGTCREGWVSFQTSCYVLTSTAMSWSKAEEQCQRHGGHLVVLNNVEELDYISKVVNIKYNYWIGLVEREHEGHWSWVDGTDFNSTPTFWDNGQPDNWDYSENGEDCGQIHASERRKRKMWNDADCNLTHHFICETRA